MRIFILTSDKTSWMLPACLWLLHKYWPQHPEGLIGGYTPPKFYLPAWAKFLSLGLFANFPIDRWSDGLIKFLESQPDPFFLWTMDDFWLVRPVDDNGVRLLFAHLAGSPWLARIDMTTDRLYNGDMQAAGRLGHLHLVSTPPNSSYQLSFQSGLRRREALLQYLTPGETAAEAETRGAHRMTLASANVLGTVEAPFRYLIAMQHGQLCIDGGGYQVPRVELPEEDRQVLAGFGYLTPPELVPA